MRRQMRQRQQMRRLTLRLTMRSALLHKQQKQQPPLPQQPRYMSTRHVSHHARTHGRRRHRRRCRQTPHTCAAQRASEVAAALALGLCLCLCVPSSMLRLTHARTRRNVLAASHAWLTHTHTDKKSARYAEYASSTHLPHTRSACCWLRLHETRVMNGRN